MPPVVLVASPLLGPAAWQPVCDWMRETGLDALVLGVEVAASAAPPGSVLVPHSNAGYHAPLLAERTRAVATVYVDAALAAPHGADTSLAPPRFLDFLRGLVRPDGLLPPWTQWWDDLEGVFPSAEARAQVEAGEPRLPLDYFTRRVAVPAGWTARPCGYLAFGATYAEELALARELGWPVRRMDGRHLHQLHDPAGVGAAVLDLAGRLTPAG